MRHDLTISYLQTSEAVESLELYETIGDQRKVKVHCRLWDGLGSMTPEDAKAFVAEFNQSTAAMRAKWKRLFEDKASARFVHQRGVNP